jgi:hypothetical protein
MERSTKIILSLTALAAAGGVGYFIYNRKSTEQTISTVGNQVTEITNVEANPNATLANTLEGRAISVVDEGYSVYLIRNGTRQMLVDANRYKKGDYERKLSQELAKYFGDGNKNTALEKKLLVLVSADQARQFPVGAALGSLPMIY